MPWSDERPVINRRPLYRRPNWWIEDALEMFLALLLAIIITLIIYVSLVIGGFVFMFKFSESLEHLDRQEASTVLYMDNDVAELQK